MGQHRQDGLCICIICVGVLRVISWPFDNRNSLSAERKKNTWQTNIETPLTIKWLKKEHGLVFVLGEKLEEMSQDGAGRATREKRGLSSNWKRHTHSLTPHVNDSSDRCQQITVGVEGHAPRTTEVLEVNPGRPAGIL